MDPMLTPQERNMREEMLQHTFPFDEGAWMEMELLLDRDREEPPGALPPRPPKGLPGASRWRKAGVLLLLPVALGAALVWLKMTGLFSISRIVQSEGPEISMQPRAIPNTPDTLTFKEAYPQSPLLPADEGASNTFLPEITAPNGQTEPALTAVSPPPDHSYPAGRRLQKTASGAPNKSQTTNRYVPRSSPVAGISPGIQQGRTISEGFYQKKNAATGALENAGSHQDATTMQMGETATRDAGHTADPNLAPAASATGQASSVASLGASTGHLVGVDRLPLLPAALLQPEKRNDSIIRPLQLSLLNRKRWERGWIFGLNANTVDNRPLRWSVLPHLGYFTNFRLGRGFSVQTELVAKFVTGYRLRGEVQYIVPGGSLERILDYNNLLFLELPLLVKHNATPNTAWLLGIKPSWNWVVAPYGSSSLSGLDPPNLDFSDHVGLRQFDLGITAGWEWRLGRRWALDIRYNQGLYDLSFDNFFKNRDIHLNSDLQVSLRHYFTKKMRRHAPKTLFPVSD